MKWTDEELLNLLLAIGTDEKVAAEWLEHRATLPRKLKARLREEWKRKQAIAAAFLQF